MKVSDSVVPVQPEPVLELFTVPVIVTSVSPPYVASGAKDKTVALAACRTDDASRADMGR